jgi:glyoxylase I family protein
MPPLNYRIEHFGIAARDPRTLANWYLQTLGGRETWENGQTPPAVFVELAGGLILEIYPASGSHPEVITLNGNAGWRHLALRVGHLESARDQLQAAGVRFPDPIKPAGGGGRVLFFQDPEGNLLHLVERPTGEALAHL